MLEKYLKARVEFIQLCDAAHSTAAKKFWEKRVKWCEKKIIQARKRAIEEDWRAALMKRLKILVIIVNVAVIMSILGCNAVQGVGSDITWFGAAGQEMLEHGHEVK